MEQKLAQKLKKLGHPQDLIRVVTRAQLETKEQFEQMISFLETKPKATKEEILIMGMAIAGEI
ncbi:MAG: hypothetical protein E7551_03985 [Ruminococcaceae bacterium]|nr:hypothetical protein [Oscillospiraceae bacterium]